MNDVTRYYLQELQTKYKKPQLSRKQVAEVLNISLSTLENLIIRNELPIRHHRLGTSQKAKYVFPIIEVANFLAFENAA